MNKLNQREKILAGIVIGAVVFVLNVAVLRYFFSTYGELTQETAREQAQLQSMQGLLANTGLWEQRDAWLNAHQPKLENDAFAGSQLLDQVQKVAKANSITVEQPQLANPERHPLYTAVTVNLETKSTWDSLKKFLVAMQGPEQFIVIEGANLRVDTSDPTQMRGRFRIAKWFAPR
jgi:hypothetical protein